ncbi:hypothetical protein RFI_12781, partial [Reticulomyxa filosa]
KKKKKKKKKVLAKSIQIKWNNDCSDFVDPSLGLLINILEADSPTFDAMMHVFEEGLSILREKSFLDEGIHFVETAICNLLNLLQVLVRLENSFLNFCEKSLADAPNVQPLAVSLLSGQYRPQIINLASCVAFAHPTIRIQSLKILSYLNRYPYDFTLSNCFIERDHLSVIEHAFSSQLRTRPALRNVPDDAIDNRIAIVQFLAESLQMKEHILVLSLLGFSDTSPSRDDFRSPNSCLAQILLLCRNPKICQETPELAEKCLECLYVLLQHPKVSGRAVRACEDYPSLFVNLLSNCMQCTDIKELTTRKAGVEKGPEDPLFKNQAVVKHYFNQRSWLFKCIALYYAMFKHFPSLFVPRHVIVTNPELVPNYSPLDTDSWVTLGFLKSEYDESEFEAKEKERMWARYGTTSYAFKDEHDNIDEKVADGQSFAGRSGRGNKPITNAIAVFLGESDVDLGEIQKFSYKPTMLGIRVDSFKRPFDKSFDDFEWKIDELTEELLQVLSFFFFFDLI